MEGSLISELQTQSPDQPNAEIPAAKKGKSLHKTVVKVKAVAGGGIGKQKNEGTPGDSWSWRKYGQKPIKGSPYPRGYYRCSTSKGCSAKKQVERCRTDASMLLVTYTSTHNHPGPTRNQPIQELAEEEEQNRDEISKGEQFNYFEPPQGVSPNPFTVDLDNTHESLGVLFDEEPIFYPPPIPIRTTPKPESDGSNDFFDELEELPMSHIFSPTPASPTIGFS